MEENMKTENLVEKSTREQLERHLNAGETLQEFARGGNKGVSEIALSLGCLLGILPGILLIIFSKIGNKEFLIGLTDQRIITQAEGSSDVTSLPLSELRGLKFRPGAYNGTLDIQHSDGRIESYYFTVAFWSRHAMEMAKLAPQKVA
jgi:hypothetical protein